MTADNGNIDFWSFNPGLDTFIRITDLSAFYTGGCAGFALNNRGYVQLAFTNDFWCYNPITNIWSKQTNFPGQTRATTIGFTIAGVGYTGLGSKSGYFNDFWEYDPNGTGIKEKEETSYDNQHSIGAF